MKNNSLMKIKATSILGKILNLLKNIFHKKEKYNNSKLQEIKQENNLIDRIREKRKIIELQNKYEACAIKEEDLTEKEKENLIALYKEQISTIEDDIKEKLKDLEIYKQKIIIAKKK